MIFIEIGNYKFFYVHNVKYICQIGNNTFLLEMFTCQNIRYEFKINPRVRRTGYAALAQF